MRKKVKISERRCENFEIVKTKISDNKEKSQILPQFWDDEMFKF